MGDLVIFLGQSGVFYCERGGGKGAVTPQFHQCRQKKFSVNGVGGGGGQGVTTLKEKICQQYFSVRPP